MQVLADVSKVAQNTATTSTVAKKRSPWNVTLVVISILAIIALVITIITYSMLKNAEKLYKEQTEQLVDIYSKKLDAEIAAAKENNDSGKTATA